MDAAKQAEIRTMTTYRCDCGDWSGEPCHWTGEAADMAIVEWMPDESRASHAAAANSGSYPANGARRAAVERSCADLMVETDGEWVRIITGDAAAIAAIATEAADDDADAPRLMDYHTGDDIRAATEEEIEASREAGDTGVILLAADGSILQADDAGADEARRVYVQE